MSLWFDSRRHEYAMDGKNEWFIKYCDKTIAKLAADLRNLFEEHFKGLANRHNADDVDYDETLTVKEKIDKETEERKGADNALNAALQAEMTKRAGDDEKIRKSVSDEASARENADSALDGKLDAELAKRQSEDGKLQEQIDDLEKDVYAKGTWANPFVITDPGTDLATLVDKGVYYFDFGEKNNASVNAKGPAGSVYYINRCYMRVVPAVGSATEQKGAHQILYGIYDDESVCLHRAVNAVEHRAVNEWHALLDYSMDDTYRNRFSSVEARLTALEGLINS